MHPRGVPVVPAAPRRPLLSRNPRTKKVPAPLPSRTRPAISALVPLLKVGCIILGGGGGQNAAVVHRGRRAPLPSRTRPSVSALVPLLKVRCIIFGVEGVKMLPSCTAAAPPARRQTRSQSRASADPVGLGGAVHSPSPPRRRRRS